MTRKKMNSAILGANGGLDSARALKTARNVLLNHDLRQPVLYHMVLTGSQDIKTYQAVIKSLVRRLRSRCRTEYFGAYEVEPEEGKGLHAHCFLLIETSEKTPFKIMNVNDGEYLHKLAERHKLVNKDGSTRRIHVAKPKNRMHDGHFFARPVGDDKLANCLSWIEYEYKSRSKEGVQSRETYFNSEFKSNTAKRAVERIEKGYVAPTPPAAPQAAEKVVAPVTETKGNELNAADKYVAGKYEKAVGKQLNLEEIRLFLLAEGIKRTPAQVINDLDVRFSFHGYAGSHPAPPKLTYAEIDAQLGREHIPIRTDRHPSNTDRAFSLPLVGVRLGRTDTQTHTDKEQDDSPLEKTLRRASSQSKARSYEAPGSPYSSSSSSTLGLA